MPNETLKLTGFRVYAGATRALLLGVADVELPKIETMTETLTGATIAGEIESPTPGHLKAMSVKLAFRTVTDAGVTLNAPGPHILDIRGSVQTQDSALGTGGYEAWVVEVRGQTKVYDPGKLEGGKPMGTSAEIAVHAITIKRDGKERLAWDALNYIFRVDGKDYLAAERAALGA